MVYTISLNSSIDYTFYLRKIIFEDINRINRKREDAGGKAVNVGKMLKRLGEEVRIITFIGGGSGKRFLKLLEEEGVSVISIPIREDTRRIFNFIEEEGERILRINEAGPTISSEERAKLFQLIEQLPLEKDDSVVLSGSIPPGLSPSTYGEIIHLLREKTKYIFLDADGEPLREGLKASPFFIKPNLWELERLAGKKIRGIEEIRKISINLLNEGLEGVAVTQGAGEVFLFTQELNLSAIPPRVDVKSPVGCGDAFLAGIIRGFFSGKNWKDALRLGVACGSAKAEIEGTGMPERKRVEELSSRVRIGCLY